MVKLGLVKFYKIDDLAVIPERKNAESSGFDLITYVYKIKN